MNTPKLMSEEETVDMLIANCDYWIAQSTEKPAMYVQKKDVLVQDLAVIKRVLGHYRKILQGG